MENHFTFQRIKEKEKLKFPRKLETTSNSNVREEKRKLNLIFTSFIIDGTLKCPETFTWLIRRNIMLLFKVFIIIVHNF